MRKKKLIERDPKRKESKIRKVFSFYPEESLSPPLLDGKKFGRGSFGFNERSKKETTVHYYYTFDTEREKRGGESVRTCDNIPHQEL